MRRYPPDSWPEYSGISDRDRMESVTGIEWNQWPESNGMGGRNGMESMAGIVWNLHKTKERLTVVIDEGMNADDNYAWIDDQPRIHFITTYSTYFAQGLAATPLDRFEPADTAVNQRHIEEGHVDECLLAYRTKGENTDGRWVISSKRALHAGRLKTGSVSARTTNWWERARSGTGRTARSGVTFLSAWWLWPICVGLS